MSAFISDVVTHSTQMWTVLAVPAFDDNYLWLIHDDVHAIVIDPGDATPILAVLDEKKLKLVAILLTHHHSDHVGGVAGLLASVKSSHIPVYGPKNEAIFGVNCWVGEGDVVVIPELDLHVSVMDVPGHTLGHIAYLMSVQGWLFCGDTLFAGGCGRLFEGTPEQMASSLEKLASLPDDTKVFCAHEYTLANLRFAREIEPENENLLKRIDAEEIKRSQEIPTVPSTIGLEKLTNPFLRYREGAIAERLVLLGRMDRAECVNNPVGVFAVLRMWKNVFRA